MFGIWPRIGRPIVCMHLSATRHTFLRLPWPTIRIAPLFHYRLTKYGDDSSRLDERFPADKRPGRRPPGAHATYDCIKQFSETDFTEDPKKIDVPIETSAKRSVQPVPNASLKVYPGGAHGLAPLEVERFNSDLLHFIEG